MGSGLGGGGAADVAAALAAAAEAARAWGRVPTSVRAARLRALARVLEEDGELLAVPLARFGLTPAELAPHRAGLGRALEELLQRPLAPGAGVALLLSDWRDLLRATLLELARELFVGRSVLFFADARLPELAQAFVQAAEAAGLERDLVVRLPGAPRELVGLALARPLAEPRVLVAAGSAERMGELRRLCELHGLADARLRAQRCGAAEVSALEEIEPQARRVLEQAFGRGTTLCGQLPGSLGRVHCPPRLFSRFTECLLAELARVQASEAPVPQVDEESAERARAASALGLDEGATQIAGGEADPDANLVPPSVFTNVEPHMASARRQEPLPVLCLLRQA